MVIKKLNPLGQEIFEKRYIFPGETTWGDRARVIAATAATAEKEEAQKVVEEKFFKAISSSDFIPAGRIIYGAGRNLGNQNMLNCYVIEPTDSVESIGKTTQDMYKISCAGGGIGFNFSKIRPKGDDIQNIANSAPGSISVMRMINEIGEHVRAGKNRRTALMGILNVTHPDLLEFLEVKLNKKELNNFNISVALTDRFLEACDNDEPWHFVFGNKDYYLYDVGRYNEGKFVGTLKIVALDEEDAIKRAAAHHKIDFKDYFEGVTKKEIKAKDLWDAIFTNSVKSGDPGIYNISLANTFTNVSYFEKLNSTNPCGEISLPSYGNCCLGNLNLSNFVLDDGSDIDWKRLARTVRVGVRFLDNILTINHFPTQECQTVAERSRRIGLGVTGLHYMLIKLGLKYGSEKSLEFMERLFATIRDEAYKTSIYLARDKSPFPEFDKKKYLDEGFAKTLSPRIRTMIREHGIRNAVMLTIPPCGTISMLHGVSSGIEPIFSAMYKRRFRDANVWKETIVIDPLFEEWHSEGKDLLNFVGAYDVTPEEHIKVQACVQRFIDSCISKTINIPANITAEDLSDTVLSYSRDLKGITIYRAGSKGNEPLEAIPLTEENIKTYMDQVVDIDMAEGTACSMADGTCGE